jgi:hypothetical protein
MACTGEKCEVTVFRVQAVHIVKRWPRPAKKGGFMRIYWNGLVALAALALLVVAKSAYANIVLDPGFESATGNTYTSAPSFIGDGVWQVSAGTVYVYDLPADAHSGSNFVDLSPNGVPTTLQQTLTTTSGQAYDLTFWFQSPGSPLITVNFGTLVETVPSGSFLSWTEASFTDLTATSASTVLSFHSSNGDDFLDDVSVTPSVVAVPAPLIGRGLPVLLVVGGILFGAKLLERSTRHRLHFG